MSIYSGFSNRKVEDKYNSLLKQVITLMNQIIITMCKASNLIPFRTSFCRLQQEIKKLDTMKFSQPKFSIYLQPLAQLFAQLQNGKDYRSQPQNNKERRVKMNSNQGEEYSKQYSNKRRNSNSNSDAGRGHTNGSSRNSNSNNNNNKGKRLLIGDNSLLYQTRKTISFSQHSAPVNNNNNTKISTYYEHNTNTNTNTNSNTNKSKSFFMNNNNNRNKPVVYKQNRYVQQSLIHHIGEQSHSHHVDPFRSRKIYRSRQGSHHLINSVNITNTNEEKLFINDKNNNNNSNNKNINFNDQQQLSMQQLMKSNPLVERKMSTQKRRIKIIKWDIPQINQQQQDNQNQNEDIHLQDNLNNNMEIGMQQVMVNKHIHQQPQSNLHVVNKSIKTSKRVNKNKQQQVDQQQQVNRFQFNKSENKTPSFQDQLMYINNQGQ